MLRSIGGGFGRFLKRDNATACVSWKEATRICVEMDVSKPLRHSFWLGSPSLPNSHFHEVIIYESVPLFCDICRKQGHQASNCRRGKNPVQQSLVGGTRKKEGDDAAKKVWKAVGIKNPVVQDNMGIYFVARRAELLAIIKKRQSQAHSERLEVMFVDAKGKIF